MNYLELNDQELLSYIQEEDQLSLDILFKKYEPKIHALARALTPYASHTGLEWNDLVQEGMLGLSTAIDSYRPERDVSFYTFASTCIKNRMLTAISTAKRLKQKILNDSLSFEQWNTHEESYVMDAWMADYSTNPEFILIDSEMEKDMIAAVKQELTDLEQQVFDLKLSGFDYKEIAALLDKTPKSIDNALQRMKSKVKNKWNQEKRSI